MKPTIKSALEAQRQIDGLAINAFARKYKMAASTVNNIFHGIYPFPFTINTLRKNLPMIDWDSVLAADPSPRKDLGCRNHPGVPRHATFQMPLCVPCVAEYRRKHDAKKVGRPRKPRPEPVAVTATCEAPRTQTILAKRKVKLVAHAPQRQVVFDNFDQSQFAAIAAAGARKAHSWMDREIPDDPRGK